MNRLVPVGLGAAALVVAVVLGVALFGRPPSEVGGPSPAPSPTGPAASPVAGWRMVHEFDPPTTSIASVTTIGDAGFVFVGTDEVILQEGCFGNYREGVVLLSTDGEQWTRMADEVFANAQLEHVILSGGDLYILGHVFPIAVAIEDPPGACGTPPPNLGFNVWRSTDDGASWERLAQSSDMQDAVIRDVVSVDGVLVAVGDRTPAQSPPEPASPVVWTSPDGIEWRIADTLPLAASSLASSGDVIVAAGNENSSPLAYSEDGGRNWHQAALALDPDIQYWIIAARDGRFVAVGGPEIRDDYEMTVLISDDGRAWTEAPRLQLGSTQMNRIVALPDRFLGIGSEWVSEPGGTRYVGIRAWVSVDGTDWKPAPAMPFEGIPRALAAGPDGVVVATSSRDALWFAPLSTFE